VFESHTVEDNLVLSLKGPRSIFPALFGHRRSAEEAPASTKSSTPCGLRRKRNASPPISRTARSSGSRSACCWRRTQAAAGRRAGRRHDRRRDRRDRRLLKDIAKTHSVVVVEHDMHFVRELGVKVTCLHEGSVLAEGTLDHVSADERVIEVYLGR
jgi:urea transport system ATP-binding protein